MTLVKFTEGLGGGANAGFRYTTKREAELAAKFHLGAGVHFEVPLRQLCRVAKCKQMCFQLERNISLHCIKPRNHFSSSAKIQQLVKT